MGPRRGSSGGPSDLIHVGEGVRKTTVPEEEPTCPTYLPHPTQEWSTWDGIGFFDGDRLKWEDSHRTVTTLQDLSTLLSPSRHVLRVRKG